jgi:hypothetical protein
MAVKRVLSTWTPDRQPTWTDVLMGVLAVSWLPFNILGEPLLWSWVAVGFVTLVVAAGPGANSTPGKELGQWFRSIGVAGRATVLVLFIISFWIVQTTFAVPYLPVLSFGAGIISAIPLVVAAHLLIAGHPTGWRANTSD